MTATARLVLDGLGFPESIRWHEGRVWLCNWGAGEVLAATSGGVREVLARVEPRTLPFSIDWLPDGPLLVVDGPRGLLLRQEPDGALSTVADLTAFGSPPFNELVVDATGNAYVNGGPGLVVCVAPDGTSRKVADGLSWPNGMALIDDGGTLVVADSHTQQLVAFDVQNDCTLAGQRVWADLDCAPDGICADADGAIWAATVPGKRCIRVQEGGEVLNAVSCDRGCFACMLGGEDGRTLFVAAAQWRGMDAAVNEGPGLSGQLIAAPEQPAPHAGRP
jgi:sugar lactone lactonase YvrE